MSLFSLGTSDGAGVEMIDRTHGHLAPDAEDYERALLDADDQPPYRGEGRRGAITHDCYL